MTRSTPPCLHCKRNRLVAIHTVRGPYCKYCYVRYLVSRLCTRCGRRTRCEPDEHALLCKVCRHADAKAALRCTLCRRPPVVIYKHLSDGGIICGRCAHRVKPHNKRCRYCRKLTHTTLSSKANGVVLQGCANCVRRRLPKCGVCHLPCWFHTTRGNRIVCKKCAAGAPLALVACVDCGTRIYRPSRGRCLFCAWRFVVPKVAARLGAGLKQAWVRRLFIDYSVALLAGVRSPRCVPGYLRRDVSAFVFLDQTFRTPRALTNVALAHHLGADLSKHRRALDFLVRSGTIETLNCPAVRWELNAHKVHKILEPLAKIPWAHAVLVAFHEDMQATRAAHEARGNLRSRVPLTPSGIRSAMVGAAQLLHWAHAHGARSTQDVSQHHIESVLAQTRLKPNRLGCFVRYLNAHGKRFRKLKVPHIVPFLGVAAGALKQPAFDRLVSRLLHPETRRDLAWALPALLCLLYAQPPYRMMALRRDQLRHDGQGWDVRFARIWLPLDPRIGALLEEWLKGRREISALEPTDTSPYLFPGRVFGFPQTVCAFNHWLRPFRARPQQLQASGLANLARTGRLMPRVAIDGLGIASPAVAKYLQAYASPQARKVASLVQQTVPHT